MQVITDLAAQDLVAVSHSGSDYAIAYSNFLDGVTIDQAQAAGPAGNADAVWVSQGSNVMTSQTFSAIWVWIANNLPTHKVPVVEITTNTNLDTTIHNGRILVCSQPVTLTPLTTNMGSGFSCTVINASTGNITLGSGFVSSNGSLFLVPWQSATLCCATYSAGTIAFAAMPTATAAAAVPGQVGGLSLSSTTATTITVSWQSPSSGGVPASYVVQFRADRHDIMEQQPPYRQRHDLRTHRPPTDDKLRHRGGRAKFGRLRSRFRDIDRGDSQFNAADPAITSERPGSNRDIK